MNAAVYARKSTEQNAPDELRSVTRQVENARAFAAGRGWAVADAHVYVDDGISGAEFAKRPGLQRLLADARAGAFRFLVVSEQKSIGREAFETQYTIKQLAVAGVEVYEYVHGRSLTPRNWMEKVMSAVQAGADEAHREQTAERMYEAHRRLVDKGYCPGGRLYGYRNRKVFDGVDADGNPRYSHTVQEVNDEEARVVRRVFELYASGDGVKRIAKTLNAEGAPHPRYAGPGGRGLGAWSPSTVKGVIKREQYRGVLTWNRSKKRDDWGRVSATARPESEWVRTPAPHLRIVSDELWNRVASRRADVEGRAVRFDSGRLLGRPPKRDTQNLLAGLATCGLCGGGLIVLTSSARDGHYYYYGCSRYRNHGTCENGLRVRVGDMNEAVLSGIEEHALTPEAVEQVVRLTERDDVRERQEVLDRQLADVEKRIKRVLSALEEGGEVPSLVARVRELEARREELRQESLALRPVPRLAPAVVEGRLAEWRRLLRGSATQGRAVLQRVIRGRITFTPSGDGYEFSAETRYDKLFSGVAYPTPAYVAGVALGTSHIRPEDTPDADYARLLETALKGWRPWWDSNPRSSP